MFELLVETTQPYKYNEIQVGVEMQAASDPRFRPAMPPNFIVNENDRKQVKYVDLMKECWQHLATNRPDFSSILERLEGLQ